jgi:hypothetical protein
MCRPPCCKPSNEGPGIAAVAVIAGAVLVSAKIGHAVTEILHTITVVLTIMLLTAVAALVAILVTWATARIIGTRRVHRQAVPCLIPSADQRELDHADTARGCLACGGTGTVLRAIGGGSSYQDQSCPACQPVHRAG